MIKYSNIKNLINDAKKGKMFILVDDENRENEGDFIIASEKATHKDINFMMKYGRGLICISITNELAKKLKLDPMVSSNTSMHETNFCRDGSSRNSNYSPKMKFSFVYKIFQNHALLWLVITILVWWTGLAGRRSRRSGPRVEESFLFQKWRDPAFG